jgi:hypothetical protein
VRGRARAVFCGAISGSDCGYRNASRRWMAWTQYFAVEGEADPFGLLRPGDLVEMQVVGRHEVGSGQLILPLEGLDEGNG